jgi:glycosyltransferase involved in cell wall biosynthesis
MVGANPDDRDSIGGCALFFGKGDGEWEITDALVAFIDDRQRMRRMMAECLRVAQNYGWENDSEGDLRCYERLFTDMHGS